MLTALTRRLIKEGLIAIYRENEEAMQFPVYYLPSLDKEPEEIGLAARALHSLDDIPWPEENCIIFTEDPLSFMLNYVYEEGQVANMLAIVKDQKLTRRYNCVPRIDEIGHVDPLNIAHIIYDRNRNSVVTK